MTSLNSTQNQVLPIQNSNNNNERFHAPGTLISGGLGRTFILLLAPFAPFPLPPDVGIEPGSIIGDLCHSSAARTPIGTSFVLSPRHVESLPLYIESVIRPGVVKSIQITVRLDSSLFVHDTRALTVNE